MVMIGTRPDVGQQAEVVLDGIIMKIQPGKYSITEADRFGQKISTGDLKYQDFNPFESAESISNLTAGAGLRRLSDKEHTVNLPHFYKETSNVNASVFPVTLSPLQNLETLPGAITPTVWAGEFTPSTGALAGVTQFVAVAGTRVFRRLPAGTWVNTGLVLAANALKAAVWAFLGSLQFGYGAAATAQATTDLATLTAVTQTAGPTNLFVWAGVASAAASYIAGGTALVNSNQVVSSVLGSTAYATPIQTGNGAITALSPGGGIALVYVGKTTELGEIDLTGIYRALLPFGSSLPTNCVPMAWWLSSGENQQRGALTLVFPRDRGLWTFQPDTTGGGSAFDISPWADPIIRPPNARGRITAFQGTVNWLYYATVSGTGRTFIWRRDSSSGASHTWVDMGNNDCQALGITSIFGTNPLLFIGAGNNIARITLALDGDSDIDDPNCSFCPAGTLDYADIDLGFPDEDKIGFFVHVIADGLAPGGQQVVIQASSDSGPFLTLGTVSNSPSGSLTFATSTVAKRMSVRALLSTTDPSRTPQLLAVSVRLSLNTQVYKLWQFTGTLGVGENFDTGSQNLQNPKASIDKLWADLAAGVPVSFVDRWNDQYTVRLLRLEEQQIIRQPDHTAETAMTCTLLLFTQGPGTLVYDAPLAVYDVPTSVYS